MPSPSHLVHQILSPPPSIIFFPQSPPFLTFHFFSPSNTFQHLEYNCFSALIFHLPQTSLTYSRHLHPGILFYLFQTCSIPKVHIPLSRPHHTNARLSTNQNPFSLTLNIPRPVQNCVGRKAPISTVRVFIVSPFQGNFSKRQGKRKTTIAFTGVRQFC